MPLVINEQMLPGDQEKCFHFYNKRTETVVKSVHASKGNSSVTCSGPELGQKDRSISSKNKN